MKLRATRGFMIAALIGGAAMGACSLNPQPIPPGEQADGGSDFGGSGTASDASVSSDGGGAVTGNPTPDADAGDASETTDAGEDASLDADTDAHDE